MITVERPNNVQVSGIKDTVSFGIKQEGLSHIFGVLRNQLYSDKILAVIREYTCNAVDAHTEAGKPDEPVVVTLPTRFASILKIRDFGLGLTDDDIHDIYAFYGESTKRKSNAMIGQLGLGSKSAFAYGDNFVITSFVDGVKNTYNAFIDASQIGQIAKLASEPTTEPNGVEISIAVKDYDIATFHSKAKELFRYFRVRPTVHGADFKYENLTPVMKGADWGVFGQSNVSVAIMGNIGYPIENHWNDETITNTLNAGLQVQFNIGDLEISASREKLQYTDRTKKVIKDKLTRIVAEVSAELNKQFQNCATMFDAHKLYGSVMDFSSNLYALRGMVKSSLQFKGKPVRSAEIRWNEPGDGSYVIREYEPTWRGNKIKSFAYNRISCADKTVLIDNDLQISSGINNRVYNLVKVDNKNVYVLSYRTPADKQKFFDETGLEQSNFILLSSLPKISLSTVAGATPKNSKHGSKEFAFDPNFSGGWGHRKYSDYWTTETVDVENDSGVYVILDGFKQRNQHGNYETPDELGKTLKSLATFGIAIPKVLGFKLSKEQAAKDNDNMILLWDYISEQLTEYFKTHKIAQKVANRLAYEQNSHFSWTDFLIKNGSKAKSKTLFAQTAEVFSYMQHTADKKILDEAYNWRNYYQIDLKPEHDLKKLAEALDKTYPLFENIRYWENGKKQVDATIQYVNLIDG